MQTENLKDKQNNIENMITKIINHKHTKSLAAFLLVIGLIGYASNYKSSSAFDYSDYMYDVNIQSNNINSIRTAVAGDTVKLSFKVADAAQVLNNLTASINGKPVTITCSLIDITPNIILNFNFVESAYAQSYNPASCVAEFIVTQTDIDNSPNIITTLPFEIKFSQLIPNPLDGEQFILANFIATNTDDGSLVNVTRAGKASDFTSNIHIESTTPSDITLASADEKVILSYYLKDYSQISNQKAYILDKEAEAKCVPAKEGIPSEMSTTSPILTATATEVQSSIKFPSVMVIDPFSPIVPVSPSQDSDILNFPTATSVKQQTESVPSQVKFQTPIETLQILQDTVKEAIQDTPAAFLESVITKSHAQIKEQEGANFSGPAYCTAIINTSGEDLGASTYNIVPFFVSMTATTRVYKGEFKIENTTDKSFVRIVKSVPVSEVAPAQSAGIVAIGLTSLTPTTVIPQNTLAKDNNVNIIDTKQNQNNTCTPIKGFYKIGDVNPEIKKIKTNINKSMGTNLTLNNKFDKEMFIALKAWQEKYRDTVLDPWEMSESSGYFYKTSNWSMNYQAGCAVPKFVLEKYRNN